MEEAISNGCRKQVACKDLGISERTLLRWRQSESLVDQRTTREFQPPNKLSPEERANVLKVVNSPTYRDLPPCQIVPALLDQDLYYASESTIYRILREEKMLMHRGKRRPQKRQRPKALVATAPNQIWTWDITYLPSAIRGKYHYLYMIVDIFSRKIVGWAVHDEESAAHSARLIAQAHKSEGIKADLVLHSDNGSPMKGSMMLAKLQDLGVVPSFSRPAVSNDNPFSESLFRTLKYRPDFPETSFSSLADAARWVRLFVRWYNGSHRHSALKFVTPNQRHCGLDADLMERRRKTLEKAKEKHGTRWSGSTRNWDLPEQVYLNPFKSKEDEDAKVA